MRLNELRKLVNETVLQEQRKARKPKRNFGKLVENAVNRVISEAEDDPSTFKDAYGAPKDFAYGESPVDQIAADGPNKGDFEDNPLFSGDGKSDKVKAGFKLTMAAEKWKPAQKEVRLAKSLGQALAMLTGGGFKPGGNLGGVGVKDGDTGRILDGHHRWGATMLIDPSMDLTCAGVDLEFKEAIPVLRAIGVAFGHEKGNPGGGGSVWSDKLDKAGFTEIFEKTLAGKIKDVEKLKAGAKMYMSDQIEGEIDDMENDAFKEALVDKLFANYETWYAIGEKSNLGELPARENMPVLVGKQEADNEKKGTQGNRTGGNEVYQATSLLTRGKVDVEPDFEMFDAAEEEDSKEKQNDWYVRKGETLAEHANNLARWHKLAGLIKD